MAYQELDLFGNPITYLTKCICCQKDVLVLVEPPTKQLSFHICEDCREKQGVSNGRPEQETKPSGSSGS